MDGGKKRHRVPLTGKDSMKLTHTDLNLLLEHPFQISRGTQTVAENVLVTLEHGDIVGLGEAAPSGYYGESQATVHTVLDHLSGELGSDPFELDAILDRLDHAIRLHPSAKAAIDLALHDLMGKRLGIPLYAMYGLSAGGTPLTSFTIGIDTPQMMAQKAAAASRYHILKVKVGTPHDRENLAAIRAVTNATIRVDANAAWSAKEAVRAIDELSEFDLEFVEQPVAAADLDGLQYVREHVRIPVICDESCVVPSDIPRIVGRVDGINIKLVKCGGVRRAYQMIQTARSFGLRVMMGCMVESSILITAAAHLSPLLDYADLDGNLLLAADPYSGAIVEHGRLQLPSAPGLGVAYRS